MAPKVTSRASLEEQLLEAFEAAVRAGRLDVADHVLSALEAMENPECLSDAVAEAYLTIGRKH